VFGIAYLNGKGSIVSTHRLKKTTAGSNTTPSSDAVVERLQKEANHFAGNMLGLEHCSNDRCVMSFTSTVTGIDKQNKSLCGQCHRELISAHSSEPENQDLADIFGPGNDRETRVYTADREWARGDDSEKN
jgi:predicted Zn-dependent protease